MTVCRTCAGARAHRSPSKMSVRTGSPGGQGGVAEPLPPEHEIVDRSRDAQEGRQGAVARLAAVAHGCRAAAGRLRRVRPHRRPLGPGEPAHVDPVGDLGPGGEGPLERRRVELGGEAVDPAQRPHRPHDRVARHRGLEHPRGAGDLGGPRADRVHAHVVPVPVAAVGVVGQEEVGPLGAQHGREPFGGLLDRGAAEPGGPGHVGLGLGPAAAVGVAEPLDAGHAERLGRTGGPRRGGAHRGRRRRSARRPPDPLRRRSRARAPRDGPRPRHVPSCRR